MTPDRSTVLSKPGVKIPPSLRNIYKKLQEDVGCSIPNHGYQWNGQEGGLMLNAVVTNCSNTVLRNFILE
jgi:uracil DNA glycosylase